MHTKSIFMQKYMLKKMFVNFLYNNFQYAKATRKCIEKRNNEYFLNMFAVARAVTR